MPRRRHRSKTRKSTKVMTYHGRSGHPEIHTSGTNREYIMVRAKGGGTKRLYLKGGNVPAKHRKARKR